MMQPPAPMEGLAYYTQSLLALWPEKAVIGSCVAGVVSLFGGDAYLLWMLGAMLVADFAFGLEMCIRDRLRVECATGARPSFCTRSVPYPRSRLGEVEK